MRRLHSLMEQYAQENFQMTTYKARKTCSHYQTHRAADSVVVQAGS